MISSHLVSSAFECSAKCLESDNCVAFGHRITSSCETNCKIANDSSEIVAHSLHDTDEWTTYVMQDTQLVSSWLQHSHTPFVM